MSSKITLTGNAGSTSLRSADIAGDFILDIPAENGTVASEAHVLTNYVAKVSTQATGWLTPTLLNSWINYDAGWAQARYYKDNTGTVFVEGVIKNGTIGTTAFILPTGYRPASGLIFSNISNGALGRISILNDGSVVTQTGSNTWFSLVCSFKAEQ